MNGSAYYDTASGTNTKQTTIGAQMFNKPGLGTAVAATNAINADNTTLKVSNGWAKFQQCPMYQASYWLP